MPNIRNWPKPLDGETPQDYAERCAVDDLIVAEHDWYTGETRYVGYGWYDPSDVDEES